MKNIIKTLIVAVGLLSMSSCADFFEEEPIKNISADEYFNSEKALKIYANGFIQRYMPSVANLTRGDQFSDISVTTQTEAFLKVGYTEKEATNWRVGNWSQLYNVNYFLKHMHEAAPFVNDDAIMKHYEGVGRFWRAWFYWEKVKTFGDVPWHDQPIDPDDEEQLYKARDPREFVMEKVLEDINFAAAYCSDDSKFLNGNVVNRYVALALKSRICLYEGTYRKYHGLTNSEAWLRECVKASEDMMTNSPYSLISVVGNETTNYSKVFKSTSPQFQEVIMSNEMSEELSRYHDTSWYYASATYGQRNSATKAFVNMYLNLDGSRFTDQADYNKIEFKDEFKNRDYRLRQTIITPYYEKVVSGKLTNEFSKVFQGLGSQLTFYRTIKWNTDNDAQESNSVSDNSLSVFRYAEILLNYAEAKAELGELGQTEWDKSIRLLRERSGVNGKTPDTADPYLSAYYDGLSDKWILEVRRERTIEMFMENVRRDDLYRWKMGHKLTIEFAGMHIPEVGKPFDMNGDGINDICFYSTSIPKPSTTQSNVTYVQITVNDGDAATGFTINEDNCLVYQLERDWDTYKYLYPVPQEARNINPNLTQNPGWELD